MARLNLDWMLEAWKRSVCIALTGAALAACAPMQVKEPRVFDSALPPAAEGPIASAVAAVGLREGETSYRLTQSNTDALALQMRSAQLARVSLDLKYYTWLNDVSGRLLASELLRAADRGVRVRVLLDDNNVRTLDLDLAALDSHPNLEIRVYNPWRTRGSTIGNVFEFVLSGSRPNHRMHNKAWITDGLIAIVGGRNVGDEYYGLNEEFDFRDLGVLLAGEAVRAASADFDRYWNSPIVIPLASIPKRGGLTLAQVQQELELEHAAALASPDFAPVLAAQDLVVEVRSRQSRLVSDRSRVINDPPDKWQQRSDRVVGVAADLRDIINAAQTEVILVSPYFIPGRKGVEWLRGLRERGVRIRVLTNSLNATDVPAVHGGYAKYRHRMLRAGVELHELKYSSRLRQRTTLRGSSRASLHTKAVIVDGRVAFVGSFNLDPRSTWINTEMGALIDDARFAEIVRANIERSLTPDHSFQLTLENNRLVWTDEKDGEPRRQMREPSSSWSRHFVAFLGRVLPVEEQL